MRRVLLFILLPLLLLTACRGTQPYSDQDLKQVHQGWAELHPTYLAFRAAFLQNNLAGMRRQFRIEQQQCKLPDEIDNRDTIDPNVNLFVASIGLDDMCDTIETAFATWKKAHGLPYDKVVIAPRLTDVFLGTDLELKKMKMYLAKPAAFA